MITTINQKKVKMSEDTYQELCRIAKQRGFIKIEQCIPYL